jgi:hypothetical protein
MVWEGSKDTTDRMVVDEVAAPVSQDQQTRRVLDASPNIGDQIQSGFVGPMHILDYEDGWTYRSGEKVQHCTENRQTIVPS